MKYHVQRITITLIADDDAIENLENLNNDIRDYIRSLEGINGNTKRYDGVVLDAVGQHDDVELAPEDLDADPNTVDYDDVFTIPLPKGDKGLIN